VRLSLDALHDLCTLCDLPSRHLIDGIADRVGDLALGREGFRGQALRGLGLSAATRWRLRLGFLLDLLGRRRLGLGAVNKARAQLLQALDDAGDLGGVRPLHVGDHRAAALVEVVRDVGQRLVEEILAAGALLALDRDVEVLVVIHLQPDDVVLRPDLFALVGAHPVDDLGRAAERPRALGEVLTEVEVLRGQDALPDMPLRVGVVDDPALRRLSQS
jgi:hypothetical protein